MIVTVQHATRQEDGSTEYVRIAEVEVRTNDIMAGCNHAFTLTQNIEGSWSKGDIFIWNNEDGSVSYIDNPDYRENIKVLIPLESFTDDETGITNEYGHRSSMAFDRFEVNGVVYEAQFRSGFKEVA